MAPARYAEDLAYVHDAGFGGFARAAAPGLIAILRKSGARSVVELGCGAGAATGALVRAGFDVLGLDASTALLRRARRNVPGARFRAARLPRAAPPPCDALVAVGEVLNYMAGPRDFDALFRRAFRALRPGGVLVFDAKTPSGAAGPTVRGKSGRDWAVLATSREDARGRLTREIVSFRRVGKTYRRGDETHRLVLLPAAELSRRLCAAGFSPRVLRGYGAFRVPAGHVVIAARRPG
jgi:SAM-dependent methyltransferase